MANTRERMLRLLSLLQTHRYWPGTELADRLGISERTLRRDVDALRELGYPVDASRGVAGGYQLQSGAAMPPLLLDDEEAVAIAVGLRTAANGAISGIEETSVRALTKVVQVMPPRLRRRVDALQSYTVPATFRRGPSVEADVLTTLAQACRDDERLRFSYSRYDRTEGSRHVEPHRLVSLGRRWYLVAWDLDRQDWRTFRVDRLTKPLATGARFRQRRLPAPDAAEFVRQQISSRPTAYDVVVRVQASAADVASVVREWGTVEPDGATGCVLRMSVDDLDWPLLVLAGVGADFDVLGPPELNEHLRSVAEQFSRSVTAPGSRLPMSSPRGGVKDSPRDCADTRRQSDSSDDQE